MHLSTIVIIILILAVIGVSLLVVQSYYLHKKFNMIFKKKAQFQALLEHIDSLVSKDENSDNDTEQLPGTNS